MKQKEENMRRGDTRKGGLTDVKYGTVDRQGQIFNEC